MDRRLALVVKGEPSIEMAWYGNRLVVEIPDTVPGQDIFLQPDGAGTVEILRTRTRPGQPGEAPPGRR